jgi:hypothetical protein
MAKLFMNPLEVIIVTKGEESLNFTPEELSKIADAVDAAVREHVDLRYHSDHGSLREHEICGVGVERKQ